MAKGAERKGRKRRRRETGSSADAPGRKTKAPSASDEVLGFTALNWVTGGAGLVSVVAGYVLLSQGSITAAPLFLVLGYLVLLPIALVK